MVRAEFDSIDVDSVVLAEMTAIRAAIIGEARDSQGSVDAFRAALQTLFTDFELVHGGSLGVGVWRA